MEKRSRPQVHLHATCACGSVSIDVHGEVRSMFMCACEDCQKATGTGHSTVAIVREHDVATSGNLKTFARPAHSGAIFTRSFCPECGTPILGRSSRAPGLVMLPVGLFGAGTEWYVPGQLIFARSHREWDDIASSVPRHDTYRDAGGP